MNTKERIKSLMDEYRELAESEENRRRRSMWKKISPIGRDQWRGTPKSDRSWKSGAVPISADIQTLTFSKAFGFDINDYYFDPEVFVENYLKIMIYRFKTFPDDTFLDYKLRMWGSIILEGTVFGVEPIYRAGFDPNLDHHAMVNSIDDVAALPLPDFRTSGITPRLTAAYEQARALVDDDFEVLYPLWERSVLGCAIYLHGFTETLTDFILEPELIHALLRKVTDARKNWFEGYYAYTGTPCRKADLFNDEISVPHISPKIFDEFILPYEQELADYHQGIYYWHSCGDCTGLLDRICKIRPLDVFNVGPWTDIYAAGAAFKDLAPIEVCMNPEKDIRQGTYADMENKIRYTMDCCARSDVAGMSLKISALNATRADEFGELCGKVRQWCEIARRITASGVRND